MTRTVFVFDHASGAVIPRSERQRSDVHHVICDEMEPTRHPVTGKIMTSKSAMSRTTRELGLTEVGNDVQKDRREWREAPMQPELLRYLNESR